MKTFIQPQRIPEGPQQVSPIIESSEQEGAGNDFHGVSPLPSPCRSFSEDFTADMAASYSASTSRPNVPRIPGAYPRDSSEEQWTPNQFGKAATWDPTKMPPRKPVPKSVPKSVPERTSATVNSATDAAQPLRSGNLTGGQTMKPKKVTRQSLERSNSVNTSRVDGTSLDHQPVSNREDRARDARFEGTEHRKGGDRRGSEKVEGSSVPTAGGKYVSEDESDDCCGCVIL